MERLRLTGLEIPTELYRMVGNKNRPFMILHATEPTHRGGVIYEGLKLAGFSIGLDDEGRVKEIGISATQMELGMRHFDWYPEGITPGPEDRVPLWLEVYYDSGNQRLQIPASRYELLSKIPGATQEFLDRQRAIDATLFNSTELP